MKRSPKDPAVAATTEAGADVFTDGSGVHEPLGGDGLSGIRRVRHSLGEYVRGRVSTNGIENYWSLLKRAYLGTFHYMSPRHLHRYVVEHTFRYNRRKHRIGHKMATAAHRMGGRRLSWAQLTAPG